MTVYTCEPSIEAMLSCIYVAWSSGKGYKNIKLLLEPVAQQTLLDEYIHVDVNYDMVNKVMDAVNKKISPGFYRCLMYNALAYEEDTLDNIFHCMILGFNFGPNTLKMVQYNDIMRHQLIRTRLSKEINRFQEVLRFHFVEGIYVAHFEPKSRIAIALGPIFEDRMPSENWMIIDDIHRDAVVHPKDEHFYVKKLSDLEFNRLLDTESANDTYTDLWRHFFKTIAIEERYNPRCQNNLFPLWARKHAVEFNS